MAKTSLEYGTWQLALDHPWGSILVWIRNPETKGWGIHPHYQDRNIRRIALIKAHGEYHHEKEAKG